jgi:replication factor C subunit 2/4
MEAMEDTVAPGSSSIPWIEKYRPKKLDDVAHQEEVVSALRRTLQSGSLPHVLFYGPPGTGKTSTIMAMARELYGPDLMKKRVMEINASNERGIDSVRTKIKEFAQISVGTRDNVPGYPCPPFKLIVLDEADSLTRDAQSALRRTMELYSKVTRFCILCNYVSRIIEPITSRCAKFRFQSLSQSSLVGRLQHIMDKEGIRASPAVYQQLVDDSGGDMRRAITILQSAQRFLSPGDELSVGLVTSVAGTVPQDVLDQLLAAAKSNSFARVEAAAQELVLSGYPLDQTLAQLVPRVIASTELADAHKARVLLHLGRTEKALLDGADEHLQLLDAMATLAAAMADKPLR